MKNCDWVVMAEKLLSQVSFPGNFSKKELIYRIVEESYDDYCDICSCVNDPDDLPEMSMETEDFKCLCYYIVYYAKERVLSQFESEHKKQIGKRRGLI